MARPLRIEFPKVGSAIIGVMAQRLVRRICVNCRKAFDLNSSERKLLGVKRKMSNYPIRLSPRPTPHFMNIGRCVEILK